MPRHRCSHVWQNRNDTNSSQTMIRCRDCQKILAQIYLGCDHNLLAMAPEIKGMLDMQREQMQNQIDKLKRELKEMESHCAFLSEAYQELEAQNEWQRVPNVVSEETQTDQSHTSASSAGAT